MNELSPITSIKGIGDKTKDLFEKLGVYTVGDILLRFPRTYMQYPKALPLIEQEIYEGGTFAVSYQVINSPLVKNTARMPVTILNISNPNYGFQCVWYRAPYIKSTLKSGKWYVFYGKVVKKGAIYSMEQPEIFEADAYTSNELRYLPVYSLTKGLSNHLYMKTVQYALKEELLLKDYLPARVRKKYSLAEYNYALKQIHFPDDMETLIKVRDRLVFDEFFLFIMGMQYHKGRQEKIPNSFLFSKHEWLDMVKDKLPYQLTDAQEKALDEIRKDMCGPHTMQRLLQGDVGSGKTIVAFLAMLLCSNNNYQSAIMAPTEVLASQHFNNFKNWTKEYGIDIPVVLLTGSMTVKQKKEAYSIIESRDNALIVGTHALIQEKVNYNNLGLVITDEQHRFGVKQREVFAAKGVEPHILVMSATPIPRTLAIIIYGDLDISVIDQVPAQRLPIKNCVVDPSYRPKAYSFMEEQIKKGHQVYVICPLVEETENMEGENVIDYAKQLGKILGNQIKVEALHGKMKGKEKNTLMNAFANNEIQVLVSTTVIEVGVNVPNATVMMIENADRFGLAQLHQLRGRVGRGAAQSYCIMLNTSKGKTAKKRLELLNHSNDGFYLASEDLKLRGPGDFFGIRQSGELAFQLGDIYQDAGILQQASQAVADILEMDPELTLAENEGLKRAMNKFMEVQIQKMNL